MERNIKWLHAAVLLVKALLAALAVIAGDTALGGPVAGLLRPVVGQVHALAAPAPSASSSSLLVLLPSATGWRASV